MSATSSNRVPLEALKAQIAALGFAPVKPKVMTENGPGDKPTGRSDPPATDDGHHLPSHQESRNPSKGQPERPRTDVRPSGDPRHVNFNAVVEQLSDDYSDSESSDDDSGDGFDSGDEVEAPDLRPEPDAQRQAPDDTLLQVSAAATVDAETGEKKQEIAAPPPAKPKPVQLSVEERDSLLNKAQLIVSYSKQTGSDCAIPDNFRRLNDQQLSDLCRRASKFENIQVGTVFVKEAYFTATSIIDAALPALSKGSYRGKAVTPVARVNPTINQALDRISIKYSESLEKYMEPEYVLVIATINMFNESHRAGAAEEAAKKAAKALDAPSTSVSVPNVPAPNSPPKGVQAPPPA